jgi:hypothetical protein
MSYQEKRSITSILTGLLVLAAYCFYAFGKYNTGAVAPDDLKFWASTMLIFIAIGVGVSIIIQIVFHILLSISFAIERSIENEQQCDEKEIEKMIKWEMVEDERDKLIELKTMKIGFIIAGAGFVGALVSLVLNYPPLVMLNIIYICFSIGGLCEGVGQIYYYRKGV